jgi:hypothetical protein
MIQRAIKLESKKVKEHFLLSYELSFKRIINVPLIK